MRENSVWAGRESYYLWVFAMGRLFYKHWPFMPIKWVEEEGCFCSPTGAYFGDENFD